MTTETPTSTLPPLPADASPRASDAEREETVQRLHQALAEGRLDLAETDERVAAAYAARHRSDLPPLLADLPSAATAAASWSAAPQWAELWTSAVWRGRTALFGPQERPTPAQRRSTTWLVVLALVWMALCALAAAAVVG